MKDLQTMSFIAAPFKAAASFGSNLGGNFKAFVDAKFTDNETQKNNTDLIEKSKYQLRTLFTDSDIDYDALSKDQKWALKEMFLMRLQDQEDERKHQEEMNKQMLIYQATSAAALESAYKATAPDAKKDPDAYAKHIEAMQAAVTDAVRAETGSMSLDELKDFSSRFSGLGSLIEDREFAIKKLGLSQVEAQSLTGSELTKLQNEKDLKYKNIDVDKLAAKIDNLSAGDYKKLSNEIDRIESRHVKTSPRTDFGVVDFADVREQDKTRVRNLLDWFESLEIA